MESVKTGSSIDKERPGRINSAVSDVRGWLRNELIVIIILKKLGKIGY